MPIIKCETCGKEVYKMPSEFNRAKHHYCSDICNRIGRRKRIKIECPICKKEFEILESTYKRNKVSCCSKKCATINQNKQVKLSCDYCGKEIYKKRDSIEKWNKHFCNRECFYKSTMKDIVFVEDYAEIIIKDYKYKIDIEDIDRIKSHNWGIISHKTPYARASKSKILLHRLIMNCPDDKVVDHINHNIFDNRKQNLRICTQQINASNRNLINNNTKTNMTYITVDNRWSARYKVRVTINNKRIYFGEYPTLEEAISVRDKALKQRDEYLKEVMPNATVEKLSEKNN